MSTQCDHKFVEVSICQNCGLAPLAAPTKLNLTNEWLTKLAAEEEGHEVSTGRIDMETLLADRQRLHAEMFPDGCASWCAGCAERLTCKGDRHEWPHDFSDGDTCYCGAFYLMANCVDERPHIVVAPAGETT